MRSRIASRRVAERMITDGRVEVDGRVVTELGPRVDPGSAEIRVETGLHPPERIEPSGSLEPEGDGHRLLHPGPPDHRRLDMHARVAGGGGRGAIELGRDRRYGFPELEHETGIDDVLAGSADMDEARGIRIGLPDLVRHRPDQRDRQVAGLRGLFGERGPVVEGGVARPSDRRQCFARDQADIAGRVRQRDLDIEHRLKACVVGQGPVDIRVAEQAGGEPAHGAKKTVSSFP